MRLVVDVFPAEGLVVGQTLLITLNGYDVEGELVTIANPVVNVRLPDGTVQLDEVSFVDNSGHYILDHPGIYTIQAKAEGPEGWPGVALATFAVAAGVG